MLQQRVRRAADTYLALHRLPPHAHTSPHATLFNGAALTQQPLGVQSEPARIASLSWSRFSLPLARPLTTANMTYMSNNSSNSGGVGSVSSSSGSGVDISSSSSMSRVDGSSSSGMNSGMGGSSSHDGINSGSSSGSGINNGVGSSNGSRGGNNSSSGNGSSSSGSQPQHSGAGAAAEQKGVRQGLLLHLCVHRGGREFCGVGEVAPLPGLHEETLAQAEAALSVVSCQLCWND